MSAVAAQRPSRADDALVEVDNLSKHFPVRRGALFARTVGLVKAVDGVSFSLRRGETLGLVGESGSGKSTLGRCLLMLDEPTSGTVRFDGEDIRALHKRDRMAFRRRVQAVFQDPLSSLNPRMKVDEIVGEPLWVHGLERDWSTIRGRVRDLLATCGLPARVSGLYPHEMSGGQRQRVGIARALALKPDFIVCDEAVSALDVSIQAQVIRLLEDLRGQFGLSYLFIGHDLSVVRHISHRVAVMYLGRIIELADAERLFAAPRHPYTQALLSAVPVPDPEIERGRAHHIVTGEIPSPMDPPSGCVFHPRCPIADETCRREVPGLRDVGGGHLAACLKAEQAKVAFA